MRKLHSVAGFDVAVLMGGISDEREISLKSGEAVAAALQSCGHSVAAIDLRKKNIDAVKEADPDLVFIALHGQFGEDGQVQSMLEEAAIPYTGSGVRAARIGMDKKVSKRLYLDSAVPTPDYTVVNAEMPPDAIISQADALGFPVVCKPTAGGSSRGVSVVRDAARLRALLGEPEDDKAARAGACFGKGNELIIEKYIHGREMTVGILDGEPLPIVEIATASEFFDYSAKYERQDTRYIVPVSLIESVYGKICDAAVRAYMATGCRHMARVDLIYGYDGEAYVLELNTIPGLTARSLLPMAARYRGITFPELCQRLCRMALASAKPNVRNDIGRARKKSA